MFYKEINKQNIVEMFQFIKEHSTYDTMNSWNGLKSIANNVKLYNLGLKHSVSEALDALGKDNYDSINSKIKEWEASHPGYEAGFNGRSFGYLVLYSTKSNRNALDSFSLSPIHYSDFEDWKDDVTEGWGSLESYLPELLAQVELIQDFDKLCDDLVVVVEDICENYKGSE